MIPVEPNNRNRQKVFKGEHITVVWHKNGHVVIYPRSSVDDKWRGELREFLSSFLHEDYVALFMGSLEVRGTREISVKLLENYRSLCGLKVKLKGICTLLIDKSPFNPTLEYVIDPNLLDIIEKIKASIGQLSKNLRSFMNSVVSRREGEKTHIYGNTLYVLQFRMIYKL